MNRKRKIEDSKSCCPGEVLNKNVLATTCSFFLDTMDENDLNDCKNALSKTNHRRHNRNNELAALIKVSNDNPRAEDSNVKVTGAQASPLLVGKVQFGKLGSTRVHRMVE